MKKNDAVILANPEVNKLGSHVITLAYMCRKI